MQYGAQYQPGSLVSARKPKEYTRALNCLYVGATACYMFGFMTLVLAFISFTEAAVLFSLGFLTVAILGTKGIIGLRERKPSGRFWGIAAGIVGLVIFPGTIICIIALYYLTRAPLIEYLKPPTAQSIVQPAPYPYQIQNPTVASGSQANPHQPFPSPQPVYYFPSLPMAPQNPVAVHEAREPRKVESESVRVLSDYDYYQGFVRFKVGVVNLAETVITDCRVKVIFDENYMILSHIDPELPLRHDEVTIGIVNPSEKKAVSFFMDPLMCQTVNVDGTLTYRDAKGHLKTIQMKAQPIGISCPIYANADTINTATARNLVSNVLRHHDSRVYPIPRMISYESALSIAQGVIQRRNVKHVSDIKLKDKFGVMSTYYGKSKIDERQYIIRTTVLEETGTLELFVAADDESMLAGELAKLGQDLNQSFCDAAKFCEPIKHVNITIKDSVVSRTKFLFGDENEGNIEVIDSALS